ncbi:DUF6124 family protein [Pseudomonas sp. DWP3-1-2]|uniref:DUF6124 family protein n=1 Tax=Pseudomonas sp. DWP3-1-2 TaxID=2804645 RepID=UPI003CE99805
MVKITPDPPPPVQEALNYAAELLRCAAATAYETGDHLTGAQRDLAFAVVHLIDMARTAVEKSLDQLEA